MHVKLTTFAAVVLACTLCAGLAACGGDDGPDPDAHTNPKPGAPRFTGEGVPGTLYLAVGPTDLDADLYRVRGPMASARRLTTGARISIIGASEAGVAVSYAPDGPDRVAALDLGGGPVLPGRQIDSFGHAPSASRDGRVAYSRPRYDDDGDVVGSRVYVARLDGRAKRVAYSAKQELTVSWTPRGELAVARSGGRRIIVDPNGPRRRVIEPGLQEIYTFDANAGGDMWVAGRGAGSEAVAIVGGDGGRRTFKTSWIPADWSPDGRWILVVTQRRLGLMSPVHGHVHEVGRVRGGVLANTEYVR
ncbi:MAG: TolB family protein [Solirubrobacteraceae bacterium]